MHQFGRTDRVFLDLPVPGIVNLRGSIAGGRTKAPCGKSESRLTEKSRPSYFVPEMEAFVAKSSILFGLE